MTPQRRVAVTLTITALAVDNARLYDAERGARLFTATVRTPGGTFTPTVGLDADGRATFAQCTCGEFRRDKLRKGPCAHILAASALASQQVAQARAIRAQQGSTAPGGQGGTEAVAWDSG
mgnify:CR=1 FL=1